MADERNPWSHETREDSVREDDSWIPSSVLPTPEPQDGWRFLWVRTSSMGLADNTNVSKKFRDGWIPVKKEDHPEIAGQSDINSQFQGNIEQGGLLLCKISEEKIKSRREYHESINKKQMESVDRNYLRENDPRMPMLRPERSTRTTFGKS